MSHIGFYDLQDLVPFNRYANSSMGNDRGVNQSYLDQLYQRQHSAYMDSVGQYDTRLSNQLHSNYMASSTAMLQYNGLQKVILFVISSFCSLLSYHHVCYLIVFQVS